MIWFTYHIMAYKRNHLIKVFQLYQDLIQKIYIKLERIDVILFKYGALYVLPDVVVCPICKQNVSF